VNEVLGAVWVEQLVRLQLGIAPADALGGPRHLLDLEVFGEDVPKPHRVPRSYRLSDPSIGLPRLRRTPSGRYSIVFGSARSTKQRAVVRLVDRRGGFVPRRLSIPMPQLVAVKTNERDTNVDPAAPRLSRACRPLVFPAMGYGTPAGATVLRGRATWGAGGPPAQWVRVAAALKGENAPAWLGQGDQNGEFLVFIGAIPLALAKASSATLDIKVTVRARPVPPATEPVDSPAATRDDPLWHLPVERVGTLTATDPVTRGTRVPPGYTSRLSRTVTCPRGAATPLLTFVF